jgi:hypothetical protein
VPSFCFIRKWVWKKIPFVPIDWNSLLHRVA